MEIEFTRTVIVNDGSEQRTFDKAYYSRHPIQSHPTLDDAFKPLGLSGRRRVVTIYGERNDDGELVESYRKGPSYEVVVRPEMSAFDLKKAIEDYESYGVWDVRLRPDGIIEAWLPA